MVLVRVAIVHLVRVVGKCGVPGANLDAWVAEEKVILDAANFRRKADKKAPAEAV